MTSSNWTGKESAQENSLHKAISEIRNLKLEPEQLYTASQKSMDTRANQRHLYVCQYSCTLTDGSPLRSVLTVTSVLHRTFIFWVIASDGVYCNIIFPNRDGVYQAVHY